MKKIQIPYYPFLFAIFPVLALMAYNKFEIRFGVIFRPLIICMLGCLAMYVILYFILKRNWHKAAFLTGITFLLFFSYGHFFNFFQSISLFENIMGRHRYVVMVFGLIWVIVLTLVIFCNLRNDFSKLMNIIGLILIALPLIQMGTFYFTEAVTSSRYENGPVSDDVNVLELSDPPDVYYIILDMYARPDVLLEDYEIDVTDFIEEMESLGFYYAAESQSNYGETFTSLSSTLNLQLIGEVVQEHDIEPGSSDYQDLLIHSKTRALLESFKYQIIAFSTGYRWSEWSDADIYYQIKSTNPLSSLTPFEVLLFKTTVVYPFRGYLYEYLPDADIDSADANVTQSRHIETQRNVLEILPGIPQNKNATFTFAHLLIPHPPFVFDVDGSILEDPGYYSGESASAINEDYDLDGYTRQVKFISQQILSIFKTILAESEVEPIIIIQGDHGWKGDNRHKILNMYYFPNQDYEMLYPSITPVNSFRVVFDQFFGMDYDLLPDEVILQ